MHAGRCRKDDLEILPNLVCADPVSPHQSNHASPSSSSNSLPNLDRKSWLTKDELKLFDEMMKRSPSNVTEPGSENSLSTLKDKQEGSLNRPSNDIRDADGRPSGEFESDMKNSTSRSELINTCVAFNITDNGGGFSASEIENLLKPFGKFAVSKYDQALWYVVSCMYLAIATFR
jgi:hypothetical protein